jgi:hypothetical protein
MRAAYHNPDPLLAQADLEVLARELDRSYPGAAASLREGLAETLTIGRLGVPPTLARTLRSTISIESMIEICRDHATNVKRWQDGQMVLRWIATGMDEARRQFRRVNGHLHLPALRVALDQTIPAVTRQGGCRLITLGPPPKFHGERDNLACRRPLDFQRIAEPCPVPKGGVPCGVDEAIAVNGSLLSGAGLWGTMG